MRNVCWRSTCLLVVGLAVSSAPPALAQPEAGPETNTRAEAARLYNDARRAMTEERYSEAALGFEAASRLRPHAVALYTAAQAWELAGSPARAADAFALALATPQLDAAQAERARQRLEALQRQLGVIQVLGEETTRVQLDDHSEFRIPVRLHAEAGEHLLLILRADGSVDRQTIEVKVGDLLEIDAEVRQADSTPGPARPLADPARRPITPEEGDAAPSHSPWQSVGFASLGAGVAGLVGGALLGLAATSAEESYQASPARESYDHAKSLELRTNVMLIAGGVLTGLGVTLLILKPGEGSEPAPRAQLALSLGGLRATGSF